MKKVIVLVLALLLGFAVSANAQDNKSTKSPRETHNVSSRPQSPRETHKVDGNTNANSQRPSIAPKQGSSSRQQSSSPRTTSENSNNRVQRDASKNSQYQFGKPRD